MPHSPALATGLSSVLGMRPVVELLRGAVVASVAGARAGELMARPPSGVLVYGAPGCGVSTIGRALAVEVASFGARLVGSLDGTELPEPVSWERNILVGWSHRPWALRPGWDTPGRFELAVFVPPPDWEARQFRVWELAQRHGLDPAELDDVVAATEGWSGRDLAKLAGTDPSRWLDVIGAHEPGTLEWLREARAALLTGRLGVHTEELRLQLERNRLY